MIVPSIGDMLKHLHDQLPALWLFTTGFCYVMGLGMAFKCLMQFKMYADLRMMSSMSPELKKPLISLLVSLIFLYAPRLAKIGLFTLFNSSSPTAYRPSSTLNPNYAMMVQILGDIVSFVGFIAFMRGWILLTYIGQNGAQPGMFGKAMCYIIGGVCAINIFGVFTIVKGTFGIT